MYKPYTYEETDEAGFILFEIETDLEVALTSDREVRVDGVWISAARRIKDGDITVGWDKRDTNILADDQPPHLRRIGLLCMERALASEWFAAEVYEDLMEAA